jgi:hypothetical protein
MNWDPSVLGSKHIHSDMQPPTVLILPTSKFMKIAYFKEVTIVPKINTIHSLEITNKMQSCIRIYYSTVH